MENLKKEVKIWLLRVNTVYSSIHNFTYAERYFSNRDCSECHEQIYREYNRSAHAKSYFHGELHRAVANRVDGSSYRCAVCHMPSADNIDELIDGRARPDRGNRSHTDGVKLLLLPHK